MPNKTTNKNAYKNNMNRVKKYINNNNTNNRLTAMKTSGDAESGAVG